MKVILSVPDEGYYVPDEGYYVPDEGYYVPDEGYYVPDDGYYVPDEGYYVPDEGYYVPDEGYSRKASCALNLISTFLFVTLASSSSQSPFSLYRCMVHRVSRM